jgi:hypothetical protein
MGTEYSKHFVASVTGSGFITRALGISFEFGIIAGSGSGSIPRAFGARFVFRTIKKKPYKTEIKSLQIT